MSDQPTAAEIDQARAVVKETDYDGSLWDIVRLIRSMTSKGLDPKNAANVVRTYTVRCVNIGLALDAVDVPLLLRPERAAADRELSRRVSVSTRHTSSRGISRRCRTTATAHSRWITTREPTPRPLSCSTS
jgi:hypothetical protein